MLALFLEEVCCAKVRSDYVDRKDLAQYQKLYFNAKNGTAQDRRKAEEHFMHMMSAYGHQPDRVEDFDLRTGRIVCGLGDGRNRVSRKGYVRLEQD